MKNLILVIISVAALSSYSFGQVTLQGTVYSTNPKQPVANAYVQLSDSVSSWNSITDDQGRFVFKTAYKGSFGLEINHIQFERFDKIIEVGTQVKTIDIELKSEYEFLDASVINGVRVSKRIPLTTTNISSKQIQQSDQQKDFPFLLNTTPSTVLSSDAGNGVGYTGIRIRGIDPTRVNITINGIPLNDAESQGVYWVNLPDLASSTESVQIQRGVGSSSNGGASLGASVNIRTNDLDTLKYTQVTLGMGSFATNRLSLQHNSGSLKNNWRFQIRGSLIESDGYIDRASSDLKSLNLILGKYWQKASVKVNILLGSERTYQAWWGVPQPKFYGDIAETNRYIDQLYISGSDLQNLQNAESQTYNYYTYENEVDNYAQDHYQFFHDYKISKHWAVNSAAYVTKGKGYFEQYKRDETFSDYGIANHITSTDTFDIGDVIRRRWLDNTLVGFVSNAQYVGNKLQMTIGTGASVYNGRHFGEAVATEYTDYEEINAIYYDNNSQKAEINSYMKATYRLGRWLPYLDIQTRSVRYEFEGLDNNLEFGDQSVHYTFFNPKLGVTYSKGSYQLYASFGQGNREPVRDDFRNNKPTEWPKHEHLDNLEVGYRYQKGRKQLGVTLYNMQYRNQLVLTGAVNDVGEAIRTNVTSSFRRGIELETQYPITKQLQIGGNLTLSENKIDSITEYVSEWDGAYRQISNTYTNTNISFSPEVIGMFIIQYNASKNTQITCNIKHVGRQYLDNTEFDGRQLDAFTTLNIALQHRIKLTDNQSPITIGVYVNNCLNLRYAPNGYTYSGYIQGQRQDFNYLYPMAGRNIMLKAMLRI
ncbi:MAG: TonB-dependent receptor plug domain-containing protein [Bacteroidetes bacterium]|jgi:iron complex outermembrane receptor protein|nr:TonB-dependent receptor plug domain-containing protein [Bacteroidota bacterium]